MKNKSLQGMSFTAYWIALSFFFLGGICASCSDDDVNGSGSGDDKEEEEVDQNYSDSISAQRIIDNLYDLEGVSYQFNRGERINAAEPNRYYIACSSTKEAALFYNAFCTNDSKPVTFQMEGDSLVSYIDVENRRTELGDYGYTSLTLGDGSSEYATIEVSLSDIGETHQLVFVPETFLPQNSSSSNFKSPYELGEVFKDSNGKYWLCVQPSQSSKDGYLVCLTSSESGYWISKTIEDAWKTVWYGKEGKYSIASWSAWMALVKSFQDKKGREGVQIIAANGGSDGALLGNILDVILRRSSSIFVFQCGVVGLSRQYYFSKIYYEIDIEYIRFIDGGYRLHEVESGRTFNEYKGYVTKTSLKGPQLVERTFRNSKLSDLSPVLTFVDETVLSNYLASQSVLSNLYEKTSTGNSYQFKYGELVDASTPTKYYLECNSVQDAIRFYNVYCTNDTKKVNVKTNDYKVITDMTAENQSTSFDEYGSTSLKIGDGSNEYATIEVTLTDVGETHQLVFVPEGTITSSSSHQSPYYEGDIYADSNGKQWLCVKESTADADGYFVRVSGSGEKDKYWGVDSYTLESYSLQSVKALQDGESIAGTSAWESLLAFNSRDAIKGMTEEIDGVSMDETLELLNLVRGNSAQSRIYQVGNAISGSLEAEEESFVVPYVNIGQSWYEFRMPFFFYYGTFNTDGGRIQTNSFSSNGVLLQKSFRSTSLANMELIY